ncbi:MAG: methyltransferase domain-containing protein, partial [Ramlibacter sp.]
MTHARVERHVYLREITQGTRTSLSVLAGMIAPGSRVLDLGTGSGALGQYLSEHSGCTVDGVTINSAEAELARSHYRRVEVANLEQPDWAAMFGGERYDCIVCADVLEHLREPEKALRSCSGLLAPQGKLLISVPNAAYSGLVAELLEGEFAYRDEGLLDRTHLRFFTRRSLQQFLQAEGWAVGALERIDLPLADSEFRASFDKLPPSVARYLLALPDAATYQFVVAAQTAANAAASTAGSPDYPAPVAPEPALALFSAQLYLDDGTGFREDQKIVVHGVIGKSRQRLRFPLPDRKLKRLRLDPADRPGFLHLHRICLSAGQTTLWEWSCAKDGLAPLEAAPHRDMVLQAPWLSSMALVLLHGDDPSIELPIADDVMQACAARSDVMLEVELGWPMSGDFMALAEVVHPLEQKVDALRAGAARADGLIASARAHAEELQERQRELTDQLSVLSERHQRVSNESHLLVRQKLALQMEAETLRRDRERLHVLTEQHQQLVQERNRMARHRLELEGQLTRLGKDYEALGNHLRWIESSTVFRATRPLVHAKMAMERLLGRRPPAAPAALPAPQPVAPRADTVDVIVPVYRGLEDTRRCIESVLASRCRTPWRLVVINDASPEPQVTEWLREASRMDGRIVLLENEHNLGFVATVNRGMASSDANDALLLNSDTEVANDWLDRLRAAAYSDGRVASVTPFSNNATICSYPRFCEPNELPPGWDTARLDALFAATNPGRSVDVPTGVGFCMYVRRDSLDAIGLFDVENFGKGYGEENDFCRRAAEAGWRNLHALDTFVLHTGGVSFGDSKSQREREAVEKLRRMHPTYDGIVHDFVVNDPARSARFAVDVARVRGAGRPCILAILHDRAGGTQRHAAELAEHFRGRATFFTLVPTPGSAVVLELLEPGSGFRVEFSLPGDWQWLLQVLSGLGIAHLHYHHVLGQREEILRLGEELGVPWDYTTHDFYSMCPQISLTDRTDRYCGEEGDGQCGRCLQWTPAPGGSDIATWRERHGALLTQARHVLAPSRDTARRYARMWPAADVRLAPHTDLAGSSALPTPQVAPLAARAALKVVVIGALSRIKGADLLEDVALLAAKADAPVEFHLIGYAYRELHKQPRASLTVHGPYEEADLQGLLKWMKPDLVWFPALWPETYSYTLSACLIAGL